MTGWSADGNWFWDGARWNDAVSADGRWRFDGQAWQPFAGVRSPMPPPPAPLPSAPAPVVEQQAPSWLAASEVERLRNEKAARERAAANPPAALAPELDWRYAGQMIERHSADKQYADWQVGPLSVVIFIGLWLFCVPAALIYVWRYAGWKSSSKLIVALVAIALPVLFTVIRLELAIQRLQ